jgi:hypothetical protein
MDPQADRQPAYGTEIGHQAVRSLVAMVRICKHRAAHRRTAMALVAGGADIPRVGNDETARLMKLAEGAAGRGIVYGSPF